MRNGICTRDVCTHDIFPRVTCMHAFFSALRICAKCLLRHTLIFCLNLLGTSILYSQSSIPSHPSNGPLPNISVTLLSFIPFLYFLRQMLHPQRVTRAALKTRPACYQYTPSSVHLFCFLLWSLYTRCKHLCISWASL